MRCVLNRHHTIFELRKPGQLKLVADHRLDNMLYADKLPDKTKKRLIKSPVVTRVLLARHPFARIYSMYHQKFSNEYVRDIKIIILDFNIAFQIHQRKMFAVYAII